MITPKFMPAAPESHGCDRPADKVSWALAQHVRAFSAWQIARFAFAHATDPPGAARKAIERECRRGRWQCQKTMTYSAGTLSEPLLAGGGGVWPSAAELARVSYLARRRQCEPRTTVYVTLASQSTGCHGSAPLTRPPRPREVSHDLHVSQIWLSLNAEQRSTWMHEDLLVADTPELRPDAVLWREPPVCIDFIGRYSAARLAAMVDHYRRHEFAFELW